MAAILGIVLSVAAFIVVGNWERHEIEEQFERTAGARALALEGSIASNVEALQDIRSLYGASVHVERQEFSSFVEHELGEHPSIQALEWIPRVPSSDRSAYEEAARNEGFTEFRIVEREAQGTMVPAGFREEYFPVYYVEPYEGNEAALGFDLASNPVRLEALNKSRDTGQGVATARITLVQEAEDQFGFLVFLPIYRKSGLSAINP
jgi:CHASE1-domain containing sensor protein